MVKYPIEKCKSCLIADLQFGTF